MVKDICKRFSLLLLCVLMICVMLPTTAYAAETPLAGLAVDGLTANYDGVETWSAKKDTITGRTSCSGCSGTAETTLTLTNNKGTEAKLMFGYSATISGTGSIKIGNTTYETNGSGSYNESIGAGETLTIKLSVITSGKDDVSKAEIDLTGIALVADIMVDVVFQPAENGTYTVDGKAITEDYPKTQSSLATYRVEATPADGYRFMGWYDVTHDKYINTSATTALNIVQNCTITARFANKAAALFETGGQRFVDLNEAITYAQSNGQDKITQIADGSISGNYTIPAGITLLIPYNDAGTVLTTAPENAAAGEEQIPYKTLTMEEGSSITVNGAISIGGKHFATSQSYACATTGAYGWIKTSDNSTITINAGGKLYAWGYITGNGNITAEDGATVYEYFQVRDWRGGSQSSSMDHNVFPFSQYYVQNIESRLLLKKGAEEKVYFATLLKNKYVSSFVNFVGENDSMFTPDGEFTKWYDANSDRMVFDIVGNAALNSIKLNISYIFITVDVDSKDYVLPINNNVDLNVHTGTVVINQDLALLPGVNVTIDADAEVQMAQGNSLYVYDKDQWSTSCVWGSNGDGIKQLAYSPSWAAGKAPSRLTSDAKIDVNGKLTALGNIYTTQGGADICSSNGTGVYVQQNTPGTAIVTYQYDQNKEKYIEIPITPASLHNANDSYTETAKASAGARFWYQDGMWRAEGLTKVSNADGNKEHNFYYYFDENGDMVKNVPLSGKDYWVEKTNGLLPQWGYYFDENGVILHDDAFQNGIQEDGYYYIDGIKVHQGIFEEDGNYYYARRDGKLVKDQWYYCERMNGLYPEGNYHFDADGKMFTGSGIVEEDGSLYYYVNGLRTYAGLIEIDGSYYYVKTNGEVVHGKNYWITKTNGLMQEKSYTFDADGKMTNPSELKDSTKADGINLSDMCYYKDGLKYYAGLIEIDGAYYYVKTSGEVVHGQKYWITKTNGLMKESSYTFADDGKMIL